MAFANSAWTVTIGGVSVPISDSTLNIDLAIGRRSTCSFTVDDKAGQYHFNQGAQILLTNAAGALVFGGFVSKSKERKASYSGALKHSITGIDYHYLADKRLVANTYVNQTTDFMVKDIVNNYLAAEGVWFNNGENCLTVNQSSPNAGLTGFSTANSNLITGNVQATMNLDTTYAYTGNTSLHFNTGVVTTGASGVEIVPGVSVAANATVTVSFYYITKQSGGSIRVHDYTNNTSPAGATLTTPATTWTRASYTWTQGAAPSSDLRFCIRSSTQNQEMWIDGLQVEVSASASTWRLGSTKSIAAGMMMTEMTHNYESPASGFDRMAQSEGYWWAIDQFKCIWYQPYTGLVAQWVLDGTQAEYDTVTAERGNQQYRNRQWVVGGKDKTSTQTQSFKGDGVNRNFTLGYQLAQTPTIKVNGVTKTVGIKGVNTSGFDWYWAKDDATITQDNAGTLLINTDTLQVTYVGEYPIVAISTDTNAVSMQQALEGGGTGYVESKYESATISSTAAAFDIANSLIAHYGVSVTTLTFGTLKSGLMPGQLLTVNLATHGLNNVQMLVESINISDSDAYNVWYTVNLVGAAYDTNWLSLWTNILRKSQIQIDQSNQGTPQIVALLANSPLTFTWTMTNTQTVYACPVPSPTLFPGPSLFPC